MANYAGYYVYEQSHLAEHEDDQYAGQRGYIKGTDFSLPYYSSWSRRHDRRVQKQLLRTLNCSYLSTHGVAPTLLALKQHAQSLCILIHALVPTLQAGEIADGNPNKDEDGGNWKSNYGGADDELTFKYEMNDAFDFLTDLTKPYANDDPSHHKPLTGLLNEVRARDETVGNVYHCPLSGSKPREKHEPQKPYANHHALIMHANECLERLDHEFSSTGGLLSILPTEGEHEQSAKDQQQELDYARSSLLGQWLLYTQHLVARMHDLERSYANALDALAGEAVIPLQARAAAGPGANGRPVIFPQDRFVLANAGDDVFDHIHRVLDKSEATMRAKEEIWRNNGVVGSQIWQSERGGASFQRGIVAVNISTRYYRLAGHGHNTIFVVPAWDSHPGVEQTKLVEDQPTIVASIQPTFPKRVTELEKQFADGHKEAEEMRQLAERWREDSQNKDQQIKTLSAYADQVAKTRDALMDGLLNREKADLEAQLGQLGPVSGPGRPAGARQDRRNFVDGRQQQRRSF
ncbi:hypothetical protein QBC42DRAFT_306747 [Cladorrhinum samala]|uniref:Uncharacterized protein n=1 Tax=Cladorrhinum samala TaxID=585594 RepID=A0AAV9HLZ6_9PEZI|nr:hypothetical protein QBC42DRAFT_306747 [Cladorrhinum samala]